MTSVRSRPILVVEDDRDIRETLEEALHDEGYIVITANNGREGLAKIKTEPKPCLVLLDMMMPIMGGREFLDIVIADKDLAPIPIFILSAIADRGNTKGSAGFIKKPADLNEIIDVIEGVLK